MNKNVQNNAIISKWRQYFALNSVKMCLEIKIFASNKLFYSGLATGLKNASLPFGFVLFSMENEAENSSAKLA